MHRKKYKGIFSNKSIRLIRTKENNNPYSYCRVKIFSYSDRKKKNNPICRMCFHRFCHWEWGFNESELEDQKIRKKRELRQICISKD